MVLILRGAGWAALPLLAAASLMSAQEPSATPPPRPGDMVYQRVPMTVELLTTRRARLGLTINMRATDTDSVGALIDAVTPNGPAAKAGLQSGDILTRVNGQGLVEKYLRVRRGESAPGLALRVLTASINPGDTVTLQYRRGRKQQNTTVIAGDEPTYVWGTPEGGATYYGEATRDAIRRSLDAGQAGWELVADSFRFKLDSFERQVAPKPMFRAPMARVFVFGSPLADLELAPLNPDLGRYFGTSNGVLVINVPGSSRLNLTPGDVILAVDGRPVTSPPQLLRVLQSYEPEEQFKLEIMRLKKKETVTGSVGRR